jgi:hypothetical protein
VTWKGEHPISILYCHNSHAMSAYLNSLLTNTTSRYNNLRQKLLDSDADGDTEDDSHISRVLRAYYTEKGRPFPQWLPPDPKGAPPPVQFASSGRPGQAPMGGRAGGGLSDLWDTPAQQPQSQEPLSLRRGVAGRGGGGARPMQGRPGMGSSLTPEPQSQGRPLPSQRAGSYQSITAGGRPQTDASPPPSAGSGTTAQERLKARLWGRSNSSNSAVADTGASSARGSYERPAPQAANSHGSTGSGGGRQQGSFSQMSANSPWVGNDDPYGPGYDSGAPKRAPPGGRVGLPSGPRMR